MVLSHFFVYKLGRINTHIITQSLPKPHKDEESRDKSLVSVSLSISNFTTNITEN